jgi:endonuclease/exonuclease/phosphatase family metal-dependent hydrolase
LWFIHTLNVVFTFGSHGTDLIKRLKLLTYNIHSGIGVDKRYDLGRIAAVLEQEKPDIAALQELDCRMWRTSYEDQSSHLATKLAVNAFFCATRPIEQGSFGMAVLSPFSVVRRKEYDLSYSPQREPRYCLRLDLEVAPGALLHVFNCHLGLAMRERSFQRRQMLSDAILLSEEVHHPVILMGDFNDRPISVVHRSLRRHFKDAFNATGKYWGPTFKAGPFPVRLDHIYVSRDIHIVDCWVRNDEMTRIASDHMPVIASVEVSWP